MVDLDEFAHLTVAQEQLLVASAAYQPPVVYPWVKLGVDVRLGHGAVMGVLPRRPAASAMTREMAEPEPLVVGRDVTVGNRALVYAGTGLGEGVYVADFATVRERCLIGELTIVGRGVAVENDCRVGARCKLETNVYLTAYSTVEDDVFLGPCVITSNDKSMGRTPGREFKGPTFKQGCRVGAGAVILPGLTIGEEALIGAGAVVTKDVGPHEVWVGNPARLLRMVDAAETLEAVRGGDGP